MFCPKCGQRDAGDHRFCRGCGENLRVISKAMKGGWRMTLNRWLDRYLRYSNRKLPKNARWFRRSWWLWLIIIALFTTSSLRDGDRTWLVTPLWVLPLFLVGLWDYLSYRRLSASGSNNDR